MGAKDTAERQGSGFRLWPVAAGFLAVLGVLESLHGLGRQWFQWKVTTAWNPAFMEGLSWWHGRLSLPQRLWDTASVADTGEVFNVFPPLLSIIGFLAVGPAQWAAEAPQHVELRILPLILFGLPLPLIGYWVFVRRTGSALWGAVLTLGWLGGTALLPCLHEARNGGIHHINHLVSQIGLLLLAGELLGRRRIGVALLGLLIAAWSRQLTGVFAVALLWIAWRDDHGVGLSSAWMASRARRVGVALVGLGVIALVPMGLNWAKFGSPLCSGYELIYVGRDHGLARDARAHGLFSPAFVARNAHTLNVAIPWGRSETGELGWRPSERGTSLWLATPLLLVILLGARKGWGEPPARLLMLCTLPIVAALLLYHGTGQRQFGYYRFALDFIPVWFVVGGRWLTGGWRRYATVGCVAWSLVYFAMLGRWAAAGN